ncbi:MAG: hypothetical protein KDK70_06600, partial [Myxococcales bacterium]|nr:hypothetical protein [Myxococcales bacterium]
EASDRSFTVTGTDLRGRYSVQDLDLEVTLLGAPAGTELSLGAQTATVGDDRRAELRVPLGPELGRLSPAKALSYDLKLAPEGELSLKFPDGKSVSGKLSAVEIRGVKAAFEGVAQGRPLDLGEDPEGHATYFEAYFGSMPENCIVGEASTLAHLDRVAIKKELPPRPADKTCKAQSGGKGELSMEDWEVTVYDRTTGKEIGKQTFAAKKKCPLTWLDDKAISRPETGPIERWLGTL